jgi:hypothetical protein
MIETNGLFYFLPEQQRDAFAFSATTKGHPAALRKSGCRLGLRQGIHHDLGRAALILMPYQS